VVGQCILGPDFAQTSTGSAGGHKPVYLQVHGPQEIVELPTPPDLKGLDLGGKGVQCPGHRRPTKRLDRPFDLPHRREQGQCQKATWTVRGRSLPPLILPFALPLRCIQFRIGDVTPPMY
jgi:hypothetical protein